MGTIFKCLSETSKDHISKRQKINNEIVFTQVIEFIVYMYIFKVEFAFNPPPRLGRFGLLTRGPISGVWPLFFCSRRTLKNDENEI